MKKVSLCPSVMTDSFDSFDRYSSPVGSCVFQNFKYVFPDLFDLKSFLRKISCYSDEPTFICDLILLFCSFQYAFFVLYVYCFNYDMMWGVSFLALSFWYFYLLYGMRISLLSLGTFFEVLLKIFYMLL